MYQKVWLEPTFEGDTDFLEFTKKGKIGLVDVFRLHKYFIDQEKIFGKGDENNKVPKSPLVQDIVTRHLMLF